MRLVRALPFLERSIQGFARDADRDGAAIRSISPGRSALNSNVASLAGAAELSERQEAVRHDAFERLSLRVANIHLEIDPAADFQVAFDRLGLGRHVDFGDRVECFRAVRLYVAKRPSAETSSFSPPKPAQKSFHWSHSTPKIPFPGMTTV